MQDREGQSEEQARTPNSPGVLEGPGRPSLPLVRLGPAKGVNGVMERSGHSKVNQYPGWEWGSTGGSMFGLESTKSCLGKGAEVRAGWGPLTVAPLAPLGPAGPCEMKNMVTTGEGRDTGMERQGHESTGQWDYHRRGRHEGTWGHSGVLGRGGGNTAGVRTHRGNTPTLGRLAAAMEAVGLGV